MRHHNTSSMDAMVSATQKQGRATHGGRRKIYGTQCTHRKLRGDVSAMAAVPLANGSGGANAPVPVIAVVAPVAVLASGITLVAQSEEVLVERLGQFNRRLSPGLHYVVPLLERISYRADLREKVLDVPKQQCITSDNAPITADAVVYYQIFDSYLSRYKVQELVPAISNLVLTQLRNEIGRLTLDETFSVRAQLNARLLAELDQATDKWGIKVTRVEVRDILPASSITAALEKQMTAERSKRAQILESEGEQTAAVNSASGRADALVLEADAQRQRLLLEAQGLASAILAVHKALSVDGSDISMKDAASIYLSKSKLETDATIGTGSSSKVLFMDPSSAAGAIAGVGELLAGMPSDSSMAAVGDGSLLSGENMKKKK